MAAARTVFVSHAHADNELCDLYVSALRARGLDVWYDRNDMQDGRELSTVIETELRKRTAFVVLLTQAAISSYWVSLEIAAYRHLMGLDPSRLMLPVRIGPCEVPLLMTGIKWIDAAALHFDHAVDAVVKALGGAEASAGPAATSSPTPSTDPTGSGNFQDIFEQIFANSSASKSTGGQSTPQHGADLRYDLTISFEEAVRGCQKVIEVPRWQSCSTCHGSGAQPGTSTSLCSNCQGSGEIRRVQQSIFGQFVNATVCDRCKGKGRIASHPCATCKGEGRVRNTRRVTVNIPAGVDDGINVRVTGEGEVPAKGGEPGNLYVALKVTPHPHLRRDGHSLNILYDATVSRKDAANGTTVVVPTVDGYETVKVPPGTTTGTTIPIRGKGAPEVHGKKRGDELVTIVVK